MKTTSSPPRVTDARERPRLLPQRRLPLYAYLPGRAPHPVRDPAGHSYGQDTAAASEPALDSDAFRWGLDLFNHGFYWEAHEAWEPLWRAAGRDDPRRLLLKGLILLAAAGVKIRQGRREATMRHASRAAALFRTVGARAPALATALGMPMGELADRAQEAGDLLGGTSSFGSPASGVPEPVYSFVLTQVGA